MSFGTLIQRSGLLQLELSAENTYDMVQVDTLNIIGGNMTVSYINGYVPNVNTVVYGVVMANFIIQGNKM